MCLLRRQTHSVKKSLASDKSLETKPVISGRRSRTASRSQGYLIIKRLFPLLLSFSSIVSFVLAASAETFLTPDQMIAVLMDGKRWAMSAADGMQGALILRRDGTGSLEGPFTAPSTWKVVGEDICMTTKTPMPVAKEKCFRVRRAGAGFQAFERDVPVFTLKR